MNEVQSGYTKLWHSIILVALSECRKYLCEAARTSGVAKKLKSIHFESMGSCRNEDRQHTQDCHTMSTSHWNAFISGGSRSTIV